MTLYWKKAHWFLSQKSELSLACIISKQEVWHRKRYFTAQSFSPPEFSVLLWSSFLQHLHSLHPDFLIVLCDRIVSALVEENDKNGLVEGQTDHSYDMCLARWAMWSIEMWERDNTGSDFDLRKEVTMNLMQVLGRTIIDSPRSMKAYASSLDRPWSVISLLISELQPFSKESVLTIVIWRLCFLRFFSSRRIPLQV